MTKSEVRKEVRLRIGGMDTQDIAALSEAACRKIVSEEAWLDAGTVLLYQALPDEASTDFLIKNALGSGKKVVLPVVKGSDMTLKQLLPGTTVRGAFGIEEPGETVPEWTDLDAIGFAVIPGRAFTPEGLRLGRGRGYYDRFLGQLRCRKVGLALPCQVFETLPTDPWDIPLDEVVYG